jgi:bifunctional non-homologous end joining protein LigD
MDFDAIRAFARGVAEQLSARLPDQVTTETRKRARRSRLFLDYLRNAYAQTSVSPYTVRARPGAPVATPLEWAELDEASLRSQSFTIRNIAARLEEKGDPWANFHQHPQSIPQNCRRPPQTPE